MKHGARTPEGGAQRYAHAAATAAGTVVGEYSTSFARACRLLREPVRGHVRTIYGLVRVADEIVDAPDLDLTPQQRGAYLDALEAETLDALQSGFSTNLVVHAFAATAREHGIGPELVVPFFASMRTDLRAAQHDEASLDAYVFGSAEVVGLMCLRVFVGAPDASDELAAHGYDRLAPGARRLGAAFQKVNFLRDLAADHDQLGRRYLPGDDSGVLTDAQRDAVLDDIDADLAAAAVAVAALPRSSRRGVRAAHDLFSALSGRLRATPAARIARERVRVPAPTKALVVARTLLPAGWRS
ncbi:MAG: squalene/phytoene synthase family protein [Cellulomonas sp.]|uniref:Phytoene synthase n=1 Tax=Cellulomonas gelida TaxID=1712 RepID=A0A4Y3KLT2_9CELL|nr:MULTISPECIES: squalene/phytoene synthase family protein [Cellulomonas]KMM45349.1 phytoene synthase [Cellulomonas sp. A375-1]MCR6647589.1 squalene/phytoene synthase family protein [Cellulomonas sp.]MCR6703578.1 squalene/phytoene synthase family protein [Cellulomonas sp.]GEA85379.1 phytoene synthase [Cellulomonas gelida]GGL36252.1 phytoene synthase [Cellulomonas gelida]